MRAQFLHKGTRNFVIARANKLIARAFSKNTRWVNLIARAFVLQRVQLNTRWVNLIARAEDAEGDTFRIR